MSEHVGADRSEPADELRPEFAGIPRDCLCTKAQRRLDQHHGSPEIVRHDACAALEVPQEPAEPACLELRLEVDVGRQKGAEFFGVCVRDMRHKMCHAVRVDTIPRDARPVRCARAVVVNDPLDVERAPDREVTIPRRIREPLAK